MGSGTSASSLRQSVLLATDGSISITALRTAVVMQKIISASAANSGVRFRAACGWTGTLKDCSTSTASGVIGDPTLADTPALSARAFTVSRALNGIPSRVAISALAMAAAIGERQVLPLHTNRNTRCGCGSGGAKPNI